MDQVQGDHGKAPVGHPVDQAEIKTLSVKTIRKEEERDLRRSQVNIMLIVFLALMLLQSIRAGEFSDPKAWFLNTLMILPGVIVGVAFHEFGHALVASKLGDPTPEAQGRLTINPVAHLEPFGLIALIFCGFGWGKPVQIDPTYFRKRRRDELLVSVAGVVMNLIIAVIFTIIFRIVISSAGSAFYGGSSDFMYYVELMIYYVIQINLVLMIFNLIPVPPLDGFNIIVEVFNLKNTEFYRVAYNYGQWILLVLLFLGFVSRILSPAVMWCMNTLFSIFGVPLMV
ncbi:MAG: site-2 protease family protein [Firmicutes bacterium]|nr:site-2 protease family protein [Bacillota bacterium]